MKCLPSRSWIKVPPQMTDRRDARSKMLLFLPPIRPYYPVEKHFSYLCPLTIFQMYVHMHIYTQYDCQMNCIRIFHFEHHKPAAWPAQLVHWSVIL